MPVLTSSLPSARQAALEAQVKTLNAKLAAKNNRSANSSARTDSTKPTQAFKRLLNQGVIVDTDTHVGFGKEGEPNQDIYEKDWLAQQEGCEAHERCWLPLIARSGIGMCPDPASCGGKGSARHSYDPELVKLIKQSSLSNAAARDPDARSRPSTPSSKSGKSSRSFSHSKKRKQR